jgi:toxin ParE1/3/4
MSARKFRLEVTERASDDLRSIQAYTLAQWGVDQASEYEEAIHDAFEMLRTHPELGKNREDLRSGLRSYPVLGHFILYEIARDTLVVQRIVHQRMDSSRAIFP